MLNVNLCYWNYVKSFTSHIAAQLLLITFSVLLANKYTLETYFYFSSLAQDRKNPLSKKVLKPNILRQLTDTEA